MPFIDKRRKGMHSDSSFQPQFGFVSMLASLRGDIYGAGETRNGGFQGFLVEDSKDANIKI